MVIPKGYRILKNNEIVKTGDLYWRFGRFLEVKGSIGHERWEFSDIKMFIRKTEEETW